jgi:prefoldin alpha subunit|tara:strand:- start:344 stop:787 length:444 start_codon:yes stop_codon:yes gene_type:complete
MKPTTPAEEKEFQQKYMTYNLYKQQAQALVKELSMLNQTAQTMTTAREVLKNIDGSKESEILVPVGGNTFLKAKIEDAENVLVGVGSDIVLKKPVKDALTAIDEQIENLQNASEKLNTQMKTLEDQMRILEPEIQKMVQAVRKEPKQ